MKAEKSHHSHLKDTTRFDGRDACDAAIRIKTYYSFFCFFNIVMNASMDSVNSL